MRLAKNHDNPIAKVLEPVFDGNKIKGKVGCLFSFSFVNIFCFNVKANSDLFSIYFLQIIELYSTFFLHRTKLCTAVPRVTKFYQKNHSKNNFLAKNPFIM